ncbi:MAG: DUF4956 domain-containing protein [Lachnospiraceae bacterium]|nr:DUF4956 domain-containing protein [Lachnospiraceae bacterium]
MTFYDAIRNNLIKGFSNVDISAADILIAMLITFGLALYIFIVYRAVTGNGFYSKSFNISMAAISLVTCGIIIAMQSSLVISLGMVGALSIVRFRTAIKEPIDLLFLFWSIGTGIICGTGLYEIAVIVAACVTIAILLLKLIPETRSSSILFLSFKDMETESRVSDTLKEIRVSNHVKSRNITKEGMDIVYEVRTKDPESLVKVLHGVEGIISMSLIEHEGEFRG